MKKFILLSFAAINISTSPVWGLTPVNQVGEVRTGANRIRVIAIKGKSLLVQRQSGNQGKDSNKSSVDNSDSSFATNGEKSESSFQIVKKQKWISEDTRLRIEILSSRGNRAIARIISGVPQIGTSLTLDSKIQGKSETFSSGQDNSQWQSPRSSLKALNWGVTGSYLQSEMTVFASQNLSLQLKGSSQGVYWVASDYFRKDLKWSDNFGFENLRAQGVSPTSICAGQTSCFVDVSYFGMGFEASIHILGSDKWPLWVGGGLYHLTAFNKSSNVLDTSAIGSNQSLRFSLGTLMALAGKKEVPIDFIWNSFLTNQSVKAQQWILRVGYF